VIWPKNDKEQYRVGTQMKELYATDPFAALETRSFKLQRNNQQRGNSLLLEWAKSMF